MDTEYRAAFEAVDDGLLVLDPATSRVREVNGRYCELTGLERSAVRGEALADLIVERDVPPPPIGDLAEMVRDGEVVTIQRLLRSAGGTPVPVELRFSGLDDSETPLVVHVRDIGDEGATAWDGQFDRELLAQLVDHTPDVMWLFTADWDELLFVNSAYERVYGQSVDALRENSTAFLDAIHPEDREYTLDAMRRLSDGQEIDIEYRVNPGEDYERFVWVQAEPIVDEDGEVDRVVGFSRDITERKRHERELLHRRNLVANVPIGVFRSSLTGSDTLLEVNPALVEMFGATAEGALIGTPVSDLYDDENATPALAEGVKREGSVTFDARFQRLDGDLFWGRVTAVLQTDAEGQPVADGVIEDITERKERDKQLRVMDRVLRHNIRNDMNVVLGYADYLEGNVSADLSVAVEGISSRGRKLLETAEKERAIVDLLSNGGSPEPVELVAEVERRVEELATAHPDATIRTSLPAEAHAVAVSRIGDGFEELIENAIVHEDADTPVVDVEIEVGPETVTVRVRDEGPGVPKPEYEILEGHRDVEPLYHGSGLGLWYVYWLVRLSDGEVTFERTGPEGSVVAVTLPRAEDVPN